MRLVDADTLKDKAFGGRKGLVHSSDIDAAPTIDAIPVEWLWAAQDKMLSLPQFSFEECATVGKIIRVWQKEQEAR